MKTTREFLAELSEQGIKLWGEGDQLRCKAPKGLLTPALVEELQIRKADILAFLQQAQPAPQSQTELALPPIQATPPAGGMTINRLPLSFAQQRLWFLHQMQPLSAAYHLSGAFRLTGKLNPSALERSLTEIVRRHTALRTNFLQEEPLQSIREATPIRLPVTDLSRWPLATRASEALRQAQAEASRPFDLTQGPLLRVQLWQLAAQEQLVLVTMHHIASDGWSINIFVKELASLYAAYTAGLPSPLAELPFQYTDYVQWQHTWRQSAGLETQLTYWKTQLANLPALLELPIDHPRPARQTFRGASQSFMLSPTLAAAIKALSRSTGATTFMIFLAALQALLYRYTGQNDIPVGTPIANRQRIEWEGLIGCFVNMLVMRTQVEGRISFAELLARVRQTALAAYSHQDVPFEMLVDALEPTRQLDRNPLFQVALAVHETDRSSRPLADLTLEPLELPSSGAIFDLLFYLEDDGEHFRGHLQYSTDLFEASTIARLLAHFQLLLETFVRNPAQTIAALPLLTVDEAQQMLVTWNQTAAEYPSNACIHQLFEAQAARTPEAVAVEWRPENRGQNSEDRTQRTEVRSQRTEIREPSLLSPGASLPLLTYRQLNERANQLAHELQKRGIGPETIVGVCLERSPELIIALYAVLKAGGAYLPIEPTTPAQRVAFMLTDAQPQVLLTQEHLLNRLPTFPNPILCLDRDWNQIASNPVTNPSSNPQPNQLAYVIYTSGSTGKPKGVMIEQASLVNYVWWAKQQYLQGEALTFPFYSSFAFDLTVTSLFTPLLVGGCILIYPENTAGYPAILDVIQDDKVDVIKLTPAHLTLVQNLIGTTQRVKKLIVGGEAFKTDLARNLSTQRGDLEIYNEYGPTEATVGCMLHRFAPERDNAASVPIGKPAANTQIYLLDADRQPTPIGVIGEIYIGGAGVARGYLNRPDLTAERFVPHPFQPGQTLYATGDLGRWKALGELEFLGRRDDQIKLHGFRIELGEIEAEILSYPAIQTCRVAVQPKAQPRSQPAAPARPLEHCVRCGLPANHPDAHLNAEGVCQVCLTYQQYQAKAAHYFKSMAEFHTLVQTMKATRTGDYDCLLLLSGGKDSTYVLYQLVKVLGLKVLTFTLDNGFISDGAKANIQRVVNDLGVDHIFGTTPAMNTIFVDSLTRYSNVCNGCFKTIYTLSMNLARQKSIKYIVTGLSRGQIFETRLQDLFRAQTFAVAQIDEIILEARKAYHRMDDAVARCLDVGLFQQDAIFETIQIIDFYRYCNVELQEMLAFLDQHAPWIRPADTGRSTNCLINEVGIYVHKKERGYHNYALPYSWDVILGHKTRQAALDELDDDINEANVKRILHEIGYAEPQPQPPSDENRLVAYYVADEAVETAALRAHLAQRLPAYMLPTAFVRLEALPLTPNGKIDWRRLPTPDQQPSLTASSFVAPRTETECAVAQLWCAVLNVTEVGIQDNFFERGGHSLLTVQLLHQIRTQFGVTLAIQQIFEQPTVAGLAQAIDHARAPVPTQAASPLPKREALPPCLVPFRTNGHKPPFFCVHPVAGVVFPYGELAYQLGADQPFYGLQSPGLLEGNSPLTSIEQMAAHYVQAIQSVQPVGPYQLGGWSFGAYVAYAMAQQLQKAGQTVTFLAIFDSPPPLAKSITQFWTAQFWAGIHFFGTAVAPALAPYFAEYWAMRRKHVVQASLPALPRVLRTTLTNAQAGRRYRLTPYAGRLTLFRSDQDYTKFSQRTDLGWGEFAQGGVDLVRVPGQHMSLLRRPHVQVLADRLKRCLAAAQRKE